MGCANGSYTCCGFQTPHTDCMSVKLGVAQPLGSIKLSNRRFGRIWQILAEQLEGTSGVVQWMPAHIGVESIGSRLCGDDSEVDDLKWSCNQWVDFMAREAAETARQPERMRPCPASRQKQLETLCVFSGRLHFAANRHSLPDGTPLQGILIFLCETRSDLRGSLQISLQQI